MTSPAALVLLAGVIFVPMLALPLWALAVSVVLRRRPTAAAARGP